MCNDTFDRRRLYAGLDRWMHDDVGCGRFRRRRRRGGRRFFGCVLSRVRRAVGAAALWPRGEVLQIGADKIKPFAAVHFVDAPSATATAPASAPVVLAA